MTLWRTRTYSKLLRPGRWLINTPFIGEKACRLKVIRFYLCSAGHFDGEKVVDKPVSS